MCEIRGGQKSMCETGEQYVTQERNKMTHKPENEQNETQRRDGAQDVTHDVSGKPSEPGEGGKSMCEIRAGVTDMGALCDQGAE